MSRMEKQFLFLFFILQKKKKELFFFRKVWKKSYPPERQKILIKQQTRCLNSFLEGSKAPSSG